MFSEVIRRLPFLSKCKSPKENMVYMALFLMIMLLPHSKAGFVEVPVNQTLTYPSDVADVSFRCRYEPQPRTIIWLVNGTHHRGSELGIKPTHIPHNNGSVTEILTIPNNPLYNGTQIVCEAYSEGPPEATPVAVLVIITVNETEMKNSTFNEVPSPMLMVVTLDQQHTYKCSHPSADKISWRVNDTVLGTEILTIPGVEYTDMMSHPGDAVYTLRIRALPQNNETTIQCTAAFVDQSRQVSPVVTFLIQGSLGGVSNLERNVSTLSWVAPFSLDLTGVDPDIVYCVEVYNITCGRRDLIISECNVTEPSYTSGYMAPIQGYIYEYTVTPRSNVEGASNGTSVTVTEEFLTLKSFQKNRVSMMGGSEVVLTIHATIQDERALAENQIHTKSYTMSLTSLDGQNDDETKHLISDMDIINMSLVIFRVPLPFRRLWNYTVLANGCDEHPLTNSTLLSTHDMQDISIASPSAGTIWITGNFIPDSPAAGIIVAILTTFSASFYSLRREGNQLDNEGVLSNISRGQHMITIFIVDSTGLPINRAATIPQNVMVNGKINQSFPIEYEVKSTSIGVCITCTFLDSSTTSCVAVVHQRISQLSSNGLMNIESSHNFNRSGDTAYGCIEGLDVARHQVGVVDGSRKETPTKSKLLDNCTLTCIVGIAVSSFIFITIIIILLLFTIMMVYHICIITRRQKNRMDLSNNVDIDLVKCRAYEVVKFSRQRVTMNENPAYGEIGVRVHSVLS